MHRAVQHPVFGRRAAGGHAYRISAHLTSACVKFFDWDPAVDGVSHEVRLGTVGADSGIHPLCTYVYRGPAYPMVHGSANLVTITPDFIRPRSLGAN